MLREQALAIWDAARATLEGDNSDLARLQIEEAFDLYEDALAYADDNDPASPDAPETSGGGG